MITFIHVVQKKLKPRSHCAVKQSDPVSRTAFSLLYEESAGLYHCHYSPLNHRSGEIFENIYFPTAFPDVW